MNAAPQESPRFRDLGIAENFLAVLEQNKFEIPTPIQHQVIPVALEGKDVVGIAQTGTGKTLAFGIPMLQRLAMSKGQGLVLLPTRELALQVDEVLVAIGGPLKLRTAVLIGGAPMGRQIQHLRNNPHVVVATPGRLADHLKQRTYSLEKVNVIVLDEADRMLDIGFLPEITRILRAAPKERQTMLFSATMPEAITHIAAAHMKMPLRIEVAPQGTSAKNVEQEVFFIGDKEKMQLLEKVLLDNTGSALVFSRTKHGAKKITRAVRAMGHTAAEIHSNRSLGQRRAALDGFKSGEYRVLVATDIAARGIDVNNISLVINYDLPSTSEDYVHRIGRTGRAGKSGKAVSFATHQQRRDIKQIERLIRKALPVLTLPELPAPRILPRVERDPRGGYRGGGGRSGGGRGYSSRPRSSGGSYGSSRGSHTRTGSSYGTRSQTSTPRSSQFSDRRSSSRPSRGFSDRSSGRNSGARRSSRHSSY